MTKVAVIGNAGGGKSTLCRKLSGRLGLPHYAIDKLQWKPGWVAAPPDEVQQQHDRIVASDTWIIDGWGNWDLIAARFAAADTIILVDHPLYVHYWWAVKRQIKCLLGPPLDGPAGCPMLPMTWTLFKMMWIIHLQLRPQLLDLVENFREQKCIIHILSPHELYTFVESIG